jgi:hypothetical protein
VKQESKQASKEDKRRKKERKEGEGSIAERKAKQGTKEGW